MVKTLPTVERSTKIRFGRHAQEDQGENSIVLNASNTAVDATEGGAVYITPVRFDDTYNDKTEIVLMMYNRNTKEMVESGEPASTLISDVSLQNSTTQGNVTSNSMIFYNNAVAFVTSGNVGISNALASHTLSVGSNLYVDDYGTNVLVVSGGVGITDTTTSTSATTGALKVAGGISTEENLNVGAVTKVLSATDSTSKTTGSLIVTGGVGISKNIHGKNVFVEDVVSNSVVILDTTTSTSDTTGALQVAGGISTQENLTVGAVTKVLSATDASSKTTGALIVTGGVGISKNIHALHANFEDVEADSVTITDTTTSTSATTGALKVAGGISTEENLNVGAVAKVISGTDATSKTTGALIVTGGIGVAKNIHGKNVFVEDVVSNSVVILDTTTSTNATTGALQVAGGISTQENLNVGAVAKVLSATDASSKTTGALIVTGGVGISKDIHALNANFEDVEADSVDITDTTLSYNQTTGALKVAGGLGVAGNVHCGNLTLTGNLTVTGNTTVINANNLVVQDPIIELGKGNLAGLDTGILMNNPLTSGNKGNVAVIYDFSTSNLEIGHTLSSANNSPVIMNTSNAIAVNINGTLGVTSTTASSSKTTGAVTIGGGLGVVGDIHATHVNFEDVEADSVTITDNTTSTSATTGALKVVGGISTQENLNVGAVAKVISATDASSKTTGALIVTGGVGISKNIHALHANFEDVEADSVNITDTTTSTNATTGALKVAGGISTQKNLNVGSNAHISSNLEVGTANLFVNTLTSNVGIGTKTPSELLDIAAVSGDHDAFIRLRSGSGGSPVTESGIKLTESSRFGWRIAQNANTNSLKIAHQDQNDAINGDNYMVFKSGGNIGIAEADPTSKLQVAGDVNITDTTDASSKTTGALIVAGGVGISKNIHALHANFEDVEADSVTITDTTTSTSATTGALKVAGGISTQENLNVGAVAKVISATDATSKTTGALIVTGGLGVAKNIHGKNVFVEDVVSNSVVILDTTDASSKTTGALKVSGGLGVAGNLHSSNIFAGYDLDLTSYMGRAAVGFAGETNHASFAHVDNNTTGNYALKQTEGGTTHVNAKAGQHIRLTINNSEKARLTGAGDLKVGSNVLYVDVSETSIGVNTASPEAKLHVVGNAYVSSTTDATTTTTGALIVAGGLGIAKKIVGQHASFEDVTATSVTASAMVKGATISGTNVYGTLAGANTAAVTTLTASGMVKGATISGTNVYGTLAGANTAAVTTLTASGMVKGATISGTNVYGTLAGANTAAVTTLTASAMVKGATISGTNVYGTLAGSNAAAMTTLNASGVVTLADDTTSTSATTGALKVAGGISTQENLHIGGVAKVHDTTTSSSKTTGSLIVAGGAGVSGPLFGAAATLDGVVTLTDATEATSSTTGALKAAGGVGIAKDVYVGERAYVTGGLITNTGGVGKKTYSYSADLGSGASIANATYVLDFTNHPFHAKVTAMLIESDDEISTMIFDVIGGKLGGGSNSAYVPALGQVSVINTSTMNTRWDHAVATSLTGTTVTIKPANACSGVVRFNIFVEYLSHETAGRLTSVTNSGSSAGTGDFGY